MNQTALTTNTIYANPVYQAIRDQIIMPLVYLCFAVALVLFVWGVVRYLVALRNGDVDEGKQKGQRHMLWGAIGMAIMISVFGILQFITGTLQSLPGGNTGFNNQAPFQPPEINGL